MKKSFRVHIIHVKATIIVTCDLARNYEWPFDWFGMVEHVFSKSKPFRMSLCATHYVQL